MIGYLKLFTDNKKKKKHLMNQKFDFNLYLT